MFHWLKALIVPVAILLVCIICAQASAQTSQPASSDPKHDAHNETKLDAERGENNPTHYSQPVKISRVVRTVYICSKTGLIEREDLIERLKNTDGFSDLDLVMVEDPKRADMLIIARHIPFTFDYTMKAIDVKTTADIVSARVTVFNGYLASFALPKEFVKRMQQQRDSKVVPPKG
jgi:hypothetical protein